MVQLFSPLRRAWCRRRRPLVIRRSRRTRAGHGSRVATNVDGAEVWFASPDLELEPLPEAFGTALLVPHLRLARPLEIQQHVCEVWRGNIEQAAQLLCEWWGYGPGEIRGPTQGAAAAVDRAALCFTAGVDSFHSLLRSASDASLLVFARGYDVDLRDRRRADWGEQTVRAVAAETGRRAVVLTTNLRRHPTFRQASWEYTYGSALAALGHLLSPHVGRLLVSASQQIGSSLTWGSRWDLDPLFSSSRLNIAHCGATLLRTQKLWEIAHEPLVQRHLRVCWQRGHEGGNCGRCEKCVRTMLTLECCGQLDRYPALGSRRDLVARVDSVPSVSAGAMPSYRSILTRELAPSLRAAVQRLVDRSRTAAAA